MISDQQYCDFLQALAKANATVALTPFEASFLHTYMRLPNGAFHFSEARRRSVQRMWLKYGVTINFPQP